MVILLVSRKMKTSQTTATTTVTRPAIHAEHFGQSADICISGELAVNVGLEGKPARFAIGTY